MVFVDIKNLITGLVGFARISGSDIDDDQLLVFVNMAVAANRLKSPDFPLYSINYVTSGISPEPPLVESFLLALRSAYDIEKQFYSEATGDAIAVSVGPVRLDTSKSVSNFDRLTKDMYNDWLNSINNYKMFNLVSGLQGQLGARIDVYIQTRNDIRDPDFP